MTAMRAGVMRGAPPPEFPCKGTQLARMAGKVVRLSTLALAVWSGAALMGQGDNSSPLLQRDWFPPQLKAAVDALGDRLVRPGRERVIGTGIFVKGARQTAMRVTRELPNKVRIDDGTGAGRAVAFDGKSPWASDQLSEDDLDMTESLGEDSAESLLHAVQGGYSLRVLGERFRTDRGPTADYRGPWLDIFELIGATKQRSSNTFRQKHLVFDSNSKLLLYVRYNVLRGSSTITVQTEWSGWCRVNGQSVPTRVGHRENGTEVWSFTQDEVTISPAQADGAFLRK